MQQHHGHGLAHDVTAADHDGMRSLDGNARAFQDLDHAGGRTRREARAVLHQPPDVDAAEPIDVLGRVDGIDDAHLRSVAHARRQRGLHQHTVNVGAPVERRHDVQHVLGGAVRSHPRQLGVQTDLLGFLQLVADVNFRSRIVARQHDAQTGRASVRRHKRRNPRPQFFANRRGDRSSVQNACGHLRYL